MCLKRKNHIDNVWEIRKKIVNLNKKRCEIRHALTGDDFYLREMAYWREIKKINDKYGSL